MLRAAAAPTPPPPERGRGAGGGWGADIMRTWRQTAVRQATNEELIARFLRGCDLLEGRGRGRWRWSLVLGVGWRLMVLQGGDCGHRERPRKGNKVQKMMRSVVKFCLQHKCAGRRKVSVTGRENNLPEMFLWRRDLQFPSQQRCKQEKHNNNKLYWIKLKWFNKPKLASMKTSHFF